MVRKLVLLTTAVVAFLGQADVSTCGALFSDSKCQKDSTALLQVAKAPETFPFEKMVGTFNDGSEGLVGPAGPKHRQFIGMKDAAITSMNNWTSSRDLARVWQVQNISISTNWTVQIFSVVPVFGKDETYIALLADYGGDAFGPRNFESWGQDFDTFVMFCSGPDGSRKTQVIARGQTWKCPWPREEWQTKRFDVFLEDKHGTNLGMVVAEHDPKLLGHYNTMACVRDIFYNPSPDRPVNGAFKQWVEWMEWSSMHGLEHFLLYTFEGTDLAAADVMKPYLDAGIASRVHFQFPLLSPEHRQGHVINDCIYRAKNHAKWLTTALDVDEYLVFTGKVKYFDWDHILKEQGILADKVATLEVRRLRFARARPGFFEISSAHHVPSFEKLPKQVINVDNIYRAGVHKIKDYKADTVKIKADPKLVFIHHYRAAKGNAYGGEKVDFETYDFNDRSANITDGTLQKEMPMLEAAIAKRFNIQASVVKGYLKNLAQRHPPAADKVQ